MGDPDSTHVLVTGARGVIGKYVANAYSGFGHRVTAVSRSAPTVRPDGHYAHLAVDLLDREAATSHLKIVAPQVTHLVAAAYAEGQDNAEQVESNRRLLLNTLEAMQVAGSRLRHVTIYQGSKAYGNHLGAIKTPTKETDPRFVGPHFYFAQEDALRAWASRYEIPFTVLRPDLVFGHATNTPMNLLMTLAVYATVSKAAGLPLRFPGTHAAYNALIHLTDAELLADATVWAGSSTSSHNEIFNVTNGDQFRFNQLWPLIAEYFGMEVAPPVAIPLAQSMAMYADTWARLTDEHDLQRVPWENLVNWDFFGGFASNPAATDVFGSTIKIRQAGFATCFDTEQRVLWWFDQLREQRIIP